MKSKLFKEFIAEQSPRDRYYRRGSAEARSTEADRARQLRQQTQQSVTDYARKQGLAPGDVINQVRPFSDVPTVKKPGDLPQDVERAAKLLSDPKTNWRELSKSDPVLPPGAVGNIINALPPNVGPVPVRGPATFLRSLITPKVSKPLSVTPEIGIPPPMSRGITSQTSGDIAAGIAKAEKAARDRAGVSGASDTMPTTTSKPATNEPVVPAQGQTATTSTPKTRLYEPVDLDKKFADISAARDAKTQQNPELPAKIPTTNKASSDPTKSTRVEPRLDLDAIDSAIAASKAGTAKNTTTAPAPANLRYRDYGSREGMAPRLPPGNVPAPPSAPPSTAPAPSSTDPAIKTNRGYGQGAIALGVSGAGVAALNQPPVASAASQTNTRSNTASTTANIAAPVATTAAPVATAAAPAATAAAPAVRTSTGQIVTDLVNQARAETPFRISDQEQKQRELDREVTRAKAMDFLSTGNVGINPDAWTDKDKQNLAKMQGQGIQESIQELKKLSGLVK